MTACRRLAVAFTDSIADFSVDSDLFSDRGQPYQEYMSKYMMTVQNQKTEYKYTNNDHHSENDERVTQCLLGCGPGDLFKLAYALTKILGDFLKNVFLLFCHDCILRDYLVSL